MNTQNSTCPVCKASDAPNQNISSATPYEYGNQLSDRTHCDDAYHIHCPRCGEFLVTTMDYKNLISSRDHEQWNPKQVSALLREQTIRKLPPFWLRDGMDPYGPLDCEEDFTPIDIQELLTRWPPTVLDRINRTLCNLARMSLHGGHEITLQLNLFSVTFSETETYDEAKYHVDALVQEGFVKGQVWYPPNSHLPQSDLLVTPKGWNRFHELTRGGSDSRNPAFVAMWFGGTKEEEEEREMTEL